MAHSVKLGSARSQIHTNPLPEASSRNPEDVAIEELGHKATLPRTLTSRLGIIGTISTVVCPWPSALSVAPLCLSNGGTGGLLVGFVVSSLFMVLVYYLIAEKLPLSVALWSLSIAPANLSAQLSNRGRPIPHGFEACREKISAPAQLHLRLRSLLHMGILPRVSILAFWHEYQRNYNHTNWDIRGLVYLRACRMYA